MDRDTEYERYRKEEFEAQKALLNYFSSLSRTKATQILSIMAVYLLYFQVFPKVISWSSTIFWQCNIAIIAFSFITVVFVWQIIGLFWYVQMESTFLQYDPDRNRLVPCSCKYPDAIQRLSLQIHRDAAQSKWGWFFRNFSGFHGLNYPGVSGISISGEKRRDIRILYLSFYGFLLMFFYVLISGLWSAGHST